MIDFLCIYPMCLDDRRRNTRIELGTDILSSHTYPALAGNPDSSPILSKSDDAENSTKMTPDIPLAEPESEPVNRIPLKRTFDQMESVIEESSESTRRLSPTSSIPAPIIRASGMPDIPELPLLDSALETDINHQEDILPSPGLAPIPEESSEDSDGEALNLLIPGSTTSFTEIESSTSTWDLSIPHSLPLDLTSPTSMSVEVGHDDSTRSSTTSLPINSLSPDNEDDNGDTSSAASTTDDSDSVFDDGQSENTSRYTASLLSDVKNYAYENGRRYHSYREGHYVLPNDEPEQDRQDLLHHVRNLVLNGCLFRAPLDSNIQRALDIGTGTGIWAIDFADSFPSTEVTGTDLSPIQPSWVPPNLRFIVDDAESQWLYSPSRPFDFIHARDLGGAIADWPRLMRQSYEHLRPGGWIELQEFEVMLRSDDDSMRFAPALCEFLDRLTQASEAFQRPMNIAEGHRQRLVEAGFEDVRDEVYKVPSSVWARDPVQKEIGRYNQCSLLMAVESYSLALFTRVLGWSNNDTQVFLAGVRKDLKNPAVHTYCKLHVVYGRKPS
ncbi:Cytochrome P450E-classgroup I [Penicillium desertorum]|uniref:Cytochrome P450E-classgroup I n=1 Tax=Penicillium desertorum TaxID=1303715 RepID=A0A9W9WRS9_9EURO|nr:Cytochrome P450E-classgroup I [Penicillium desertorum]